MTTPGIPMVDLQAQYRGLIDCRAFEEEFAVYCDVRHAVGVANGTAARVIARIADEIRAFCASPVAPA